MLCHVHREMPAVNFTDQILSQNNITELTDGSRKQRWKHTFGQCALTTFVTDAGTASVHYHSSLRTHTFAFSDCGNLIQFEKSHFRTHSHKNFGACNGVQFIRDDDRTLRSNGFIVRQMFWPHRRWLMNHVVKTYHQCTTRFFMIFSSRIFELVKALLKAIAEVKVNK